MAISSSGAVTSTGTIGGSNSATLATTGSNTFTGQQYVSNTNAPVNFTDTASLYTDGGLRVGKDAYVSGTLYLNNLTVYGTQSVNYITSSQLDIADNIITVNTSTPQIRFGGIAVRDSGSEGTGLTGSLLWDSQNNHWVYTNPSGSSYSGGMMISGPRASSLGEEQGTTFNALMKGQGGDHITSSGIFESGSRTGIGTNNPQQILSVNNPFSSLNSLYPIIISQNGNSEVGGIYSTADSITDPIGAGLAFKTYHQNVGLFEKVRITNAGNVGIGISTPQDKLHISSSDTSGILITGGTNGRKVALHGSSINFYTTTTPAGYAMGHYILKGSDSSVLAAISGVYGSQDTADYTFYGGTAYNDAAMYIANKKVGIGVSSPSDTLHVVGSSRWGTAGNNLVSSADGGGVYMELTGANSNQRQLRIQGINNSANRYSSIRLEAGIEEIAFTTADVERMRIKSNGAVIRQYQPSFLAYSENSGFTVTGGGWYNISNALTVESYDIGSNYSGGRFTAPVAGRYFFYAGGWSGIGSASNGERYAWSAVVNGGSQTFLTGGNYSLGDTPLAGYSVVYNLSAGDYVDLFVFSAVTGNWGAGTHRVFFGGYLL